MNATVKQLADQQRQVLNFIRLKDPEGFVRLRASLMAKPRGLSGMGDVVDVITDYDLVGNNYTPPPAAAPSFFDQLSGKVSDYLQTSALNAVDRQRVQAAQDKLKIQAQYAATQPTNWGQVIMRWAPWVALGVGGVLFVKRQSRRGKK